MPFVVEDGTGVVNANSFTSVAFFREHHTDRGKTNVAVGDISDAAVQFLLIQATDYITKRFGERFKGMRTTEEQALPFPRCGVWVDGVELADDAVPLVLQQATSEYAYLLTQIGTLTPLPPVPFDTTNAQGGTVAGGGTVAKKTEKVDVIEESIEYALPTFSYRISGTSLVDGWMLPRYPVADLLIQHLLKSSNKVVRA